MKTTIESPQKTTKQKANIDLKIELPNSEKPFFNKMATENNMLAQVKKAGTKLDENQSITVSIADRTINLTKEETGRVALKSVIQLKLIQQERSEDLSASPWILKLDLSDIRELQGKSFIEYLDKGNDAADVNLTSEHLSRIPDVIDGIKLNDSLKYKLALGGDIEGKYGSVYRVTSNNNIVRQDANGHETALVISDVSFKDNVVRDKGIQEAQLFKVDLNISEKQVKAFNEYFENGVNSPDASLTTEQSSKIPDVIDGVTLDNRQKFILATEGLELTSQGTSYYINQNGNILKAQLTEDLSTEKSLLKVTDVSFKGESVQEVNESERSATANEISARNFRYEMGFDKSNDSSDKNLEFLKEQIKFLGFGEDEDLQERLKEKLYHMQHSNETAFALGTSSDKTSFQNKITFDLIFNKSKDTDRVFLNRFEARLTNEKKGLELEHTFSVKTNGFTAKQAINLLEGRAVKTDLTNPKTQRKEPAFVKLKLNEPKNDNGNFKLQVFNKNYGVDTSSIVDRSNLVFKDEKHREITIKSLEKGNIVAVRFTHEDKEQEGRAVLNPQYKTLNLYDQHMKRLNTNAPVLENSFKDSASHQVKAQQHQSRKL